MTSLSITLLCFYLVSVKSEDIKEDYYKKLIDTKIKSALDYQQPTNNKKFIKGFFAKEMQDFGTFDFIIVGAGSAGSVLATRLSEISCWKILLIEAGDEENDFSKIPAMTPYTHFSDMNWAYYAKPQNNCCLGMNNRQCAVTTGKAIGGSSSINSLIFSRGNSKDFYRWVDLGNEGWSYESILPYFIKSVNTQVGGSENCYEQNSFWNVENAPALSKLQTIFLHACKQLEIGPALDYTGFSNLGASKLQINILRGERHSLGAAFLDRSRNRQNLKVLTNALVTKIKFDSTNRVAIGVEFIENNTKHEAFASREVILSAGAINTPQLLMLSGIGPKGKLEKLDIEVLQDLPAVGNNLQDQVVFSGLAIRTNLSRVNETQRNDIKNYLKSEGKLTVPYNHEAIYYSKIQNSTNAVDIEMLLSSHPPESQKILNLINNYNNKTLANFSKFLNFSTDFIIDVILLHPKSKGRVTLQSNSSIDFPEIELNLLSETEDINVLTESIQNALKFLTTKAFKAINATNIDIKICNEEKFNSTQYWQCLIRHLSTGSSNLSGTSSMGKYKETSVVDYNLKVHGLEKLRVVDAGVIPFTISGPLNAATVMIAEKVADVIKNTYNEKAYKKSTSIQNNTDDDNNNNYGSNNFPHSTFIFLLVVAISIVFDIWQ